MLEVSYNEENDSGQQPILTDSIEAFLVQLSSHLDQFQQTMRNFCSGLDMVLTKQESVKKNNAFQMWKHKITVMSQRENL